MKIDKILFSSSVDYSGFWNLQSKIYKHIGIDPVCLLFGKKSDTNMSEEYGKVVEMETLPNLPPNLQMTWSKFYYPMSEPDTTWIIGDMDMLPLQKDHFTNKVLSIPPNAYAHLNVNGISAPRLGELDGFFKYGSEVIAKGRKNASGHYAAGADLPAHYHVAKGSLFKIYNGDRSFSDIIKHISECHHYGLGPAYGNPIEKSKEDPNGYYWCAEEHYSSEVLWYAIQKGEINFYGLHYHNGNDQQRIDRSGWKEDSKEYTFSHHKLIQKQFVDIHCARPFEKQKDALEKIINQSGVLF